MVNGAVPPAQQLQQAPMPVPAQPLPPPRPVPVPQPQPRPAAVQLTPQQQVQAQVSRAASMLLSRSSAAATAAALHLCTGEQRPCFGGCCHWNMNGLKFEGCISFTRASAVVTGAAGPAAGGGAGGGAAQPATGAGAAAAPPADRPAVRHHASGARGAAAGWQPHPRPAAGESHSPTCVSACANEWHRLHRHAACCCGPNGAPASTPGR